LVDGPYALSESLGLWCYETYLRTSSKISKPPFGKSLRRLGRRGDGAAPSQRRDGASRP